MAINEGPARLTLLSRACCHLCDEMRQELAHLGRSTAFELDVVDVDGDAELEAKYGGEVPVLLAGGSVLCRHRLDAPRVAAYLAGRARNQAPAGQIG